MLYARDVDQRSTTFEKALDMGREYKKRTKVGVFRILLEHFNLSHLNQYTCLLYVRSVRVTRAGSTEVQISPTER